MKIKTLIALFSIFSSTLVFGYCANSYEVANDAMNVQRQARDISYEASRYNDFSLQNSANRLASSASFLASSAWGDYRNCSMIRSNFNTVSMNYRNLQRDYRRSGSSTGLAHEMRMLANSFQSLSFAVTRVNPTPRRYDPRRYPRRHRPHRPVPPRRYDPTPRRPHRRVNVPRRHRGGRVNVPRRHRGGRVNRPGRNHRRNDGGNRGRRGNRRGGRHNRV